MVFSSLFLLTLLLIRESQFDQYDGESLGYIVPEDFEGCPPNPKPCKRSKKYGSACYSSDDCEKGYSCCADSCYKHRICKNKIEEHTFPLAKRSGDSVKANTELVEANVELCPHETSPCAEPEDITRTKRFQCADYQCPPHYKCCEDSCFAHKICKKANATVAIIPLSYLLHWKADASDSIQTTASSDENAIIKYFEETEKPLTERKPVENDRKISANIATIQIQVSPDGKLNVIQPESTSADEGSKTKYPKKFQEYEKPTIKEKRVISKKPEEFEEPVETQKPPLSDRINRGDPNSDECPAENLICSSPLDERDTKQFDCDLRKCPENFFCCKDNCFKHRICKEPSSSKGSGTASSRIREVCPTNEEPCVLPADIKHAAFCTQDDCPSGLKCCPDACFKRNVCTRPDIIIESRVEACPEEPKACNSFLRNVSIHAKYICILNVSSCPENYKCCSDPCHQVDLCKTPAVHFVVKRLIPSTIYQEESQTPGNKPVAPGSQPVNGSQSPGNKPGAPGSQPVSGSQSPGNKPAASGSQPVNGSQSPGNKPGAPGSQPVNGSQSPGNKPAASESQPVNGSQSPGNKPVAPGSQPVNGSQSPGNKPGAPGSQPVNGSQSPGNKPAASGSQPVNGSQSPASKPGASTGQLDTASQSPACPNTAISCSTAFNAESTSKFRCESDSQCPKDFKCCPHSCFPHKICSHVHQ